MRESAPVDTSQIGLQVESQVFGTGPWQYSLLLLRWALGQSVSRAATIYT
jgi:hypothetical protein